MIYNKVNIYKSRGEPFLYGTDYETWSGFGPVGSTENWP